VTATSINEYCWYLFELQVYTRAKIGPRGSHSMKPRPSSPLIDNGSAVACPDADARGVERSQDGTGDGTAGCDIGAFEYRSETIFRNGFE
jgi:hypothetical protein